MGSEIYNKNGDVTGVSMMIFLGIVVLVICIELIACFIYLSNKKNNNKREEEDKDHGSILCRFVNDGKGKKIGESIAIDGDILIIKSGKKYLGVPLKHVVESDKELKVKGLINLDLAEKMGEKWLKTSSFTKSKGVKK